MQRIKGYCEEITVLKLVFAVIIVLYHYYYGLGATGTYPFYRGYLGVEFFFMVSGYLMMKKICNSNIGAVKYTIDHAKKLYPHFITALIMMVIYSLIILFAKGEYAQWDKIRSIVVSFIQESLFLHEIKIPFGSRLVGQAWYISALLIVGLFMFTCLKRYKTRALIIFLILSVTCMIIAFVKNMGFHFNLQNISIKGFGIYLGLVRAFAEMTLGCVAYELSEKYFKKMPSKYTLFMKIVHLIMIAAVMFIVCCSVAPNNDFLMIGCCFVMVTLSFSQLSFFAEIYNRLPVKIIEEFSLAIYLYYLLVRRILFEVAEIYNIFIYFALCVAFTIFMMGIMHYIKGKLRRKS